MEKEKRRFSDLLQAIEHLKRNGLTGAGVIGAYHARRVVPLMLRVRPLGAMTPDAPTEGTTLATGALAASEIRQRLREALEDRDVKYPVPGHPPMCPEAGFVDLGSLTRVADSLPPVPEDADRRARNRLQADAQKRRKDKETARKWKKAAKEFQRRRRGSVVSDDDDDDDEDEEDEDEEDDEEEELVPPRSGALVIREAPPQTAAGGEAGEASTRASVPPGPGAVPQGPAQRAPQELARAGPQGSAQDVPQEQVQGASQGSAQGAPQDRARDAAPGSARGAPLVFTRGTPQGSSEPALAAALGPMRGAPPESARGAPRGSVEPASTAVPAAGEQRGGDKRPLPDAPGSASGSESKRARRPCALRT
uniref:Uncharacterized protein n=1 Tax=Setaria viridis TaxID=4556 RepID=A0A4U6UK63_SETVI|nr:hypothetical protein SEVIR_5G178600v2 [Setaria viridis]